MQIGSRQSNEKVFDELHARHCRLIEKKHLKHLAKAYAASSYDVHVVSDELLGLSRERLISIRSMNYRRKLWTTIPLSTINLL